MMDTQNLISRENPVLGRSRSRSTTSRVGVRRSRHTQQAMERDTELNLTLQVHQPPRRLRWSDGERDEQAVAW